MKRILAKYLLLAVTAITAIASIPVQAETAEEKGLAIALEMDKRDEGFGNSTANMKMILRNRKGKESIRQIRNHTLEVIGDGDKSMSIFDTPADVKGTASLTYSHALKPDEQWLYLPALKRTKRISSKNKSGPFMGSEFAFEDISSQEMAKYTYKYIKDENLDGIDCFVVERYPAYKYSGYTKQITWIDKERYIPIRIDFYDRKQALLKTLVFSAYKQYLDQFWRADAMEVKNHQTGKSTRLEWQEWQFRSGLGEADFRKNVLQRLR